MKKNIYFFLLFLINFTYRTIPFFALRHFFLRVLGASLGNNISIYRRIRFFNLRKNLKIGNNVTINQDCYLDDRNQILIGNNVNISHSVRIYTGGHNIHSKKMEFTSKPVCIEDNCWIFPNVLIMPGVVLEEGCVVLPGSVVTKPFNKFSIVGGNPAKLIAQRKNSVDYKIENKFYFSL